MARFEIDRKQLIPSILQERIEPKRKKKTPRAVKRLSVVYVLLWVSTLAIVPLRSWKDSNNNVTFYGYTFSSDLGKGTTENIVHLDVLFLEWIFLFNSYFLFYQLLRKQHRRRPPFSRRVLIGHAALFVLLLAFAPEVVTRNGTDQLFTPLPALFSVPNAWLRIELFWIELNLPLFALAFYFFYQQHKRNKKKTERLERIIMSQNYHLN